MKGKKRVTIVLCAVILLSMSSLYADTPSTIPIKIGDLEISSDVAAEIRNERTMVPLRVIGESLGAKVHWESPSVRVSKNDRQIILTLGQDLAIQDGKEIPLDVKPYLANDRVMVPLRLLAEFFGQNVAYTKTGITISKPLSMDDIEFKTNKEVDERIIDYLKQEAVIAFSPYYELLELRISDYYQEEKADESIEAVFYFTIIDKNYDKDPDTVGYIKAAKEAGSKDYQLLYEEYLEPKESNFDFKININKEGDITLYSNVSPVGIEWEEASMTNYILK